MTWFEKIMPSRIKTERRTRSVPEGLWIKCPACDSVLYRRRARAQPPRLPEVQPPHAHRRAASGCGGCSTPAPASRSAPSVPPEDPLSFKDSKRYKDRLAAAQKDTGERDALVVMAGRVDGVDVVACAFEFQFMGGSMGSVVGERFARAVEHCIEHRMPLVCFSSSGGARMQEALLSLLQMAKTSAALARLAQAQLPFISVLTDPTTGGVSASLAMLGDLNIAEPRALIGFAGPRVIQQTVRETLPEGFQRSEFLLEHGAIDMIVDRRDMRDRHRRAAAHADGQAAAGASPPESSRTMTADACRGEWLVRWRLARVPAGQQCAASISALDRVSARSRSGSGCSRRPARCSPWPAPTARARPSRMLAALLRAAGLRAGVFTSPHLLRYNERIRVDGVPVDDAALVAAFERIERRAATCRSPSSSSTRWRRSCCSRDAQASTPAVARGRPGRAARCRQHHRRRRRGDRPRSASITRTGSAPTRRAHRRGEGRHPARRPARGLVIATAGFGARGRASAAGRCRAGRPRDFDFALERAAMALVLRGARLAVAIAACRYAGAGAARSSCAMPPPRSLRSRRCCDAARPAAADAARATQALRDVRLPGRFQVVAGAPEWILDVAHNPPAADVWPRACAARPPRTHASWSCGILADKDVAGIGRGARAAALDDWMLLQRWTVPRGPPPRRSRHACRRSGCAPAPLAATCVRLRASVRARAPGDRIVVCGSFHTVGPALALAWAIIPAAPAQLTRHSSETPPQGTAGRRRCPDPALVVGSPDVLAGQAPTLAGRGCSHACRADGASSHPGPSSRAARRARPSRDGCRPCDHGTGY